MAIIFTNGSQIDSAYSSGSSNPRINMGNGNIVQTTYTTWTGSNSSGGSGFVDLFNHSITVRPGNLILVEFFMKTREDVGQGRWNLSRHRVTNTTTGTQIFQSGFHGGQCNTIYQFSEHKLHDPGSGGTHTFQAACSGWTGTMYFNRSGGNGDGQAWLRLSEIAN